MIVTCDELLGDGAGIGRNCRPCCWQPKSVSIWLMRSAAPARVTSRSDAVRQSL
jgi:hypothetical protein